jgi:hypothetical protein
MLMKKLFVLFVMTVVLTVSIFSVDFTHGPDSIKPGTILLSGGFGLGNVEVWIVDETMFGLSVIGDYALPWFGLTAGVETGYLRASYAGGGAATQIPIISRVGYHPDWGVNNLDVYALFKLGFAFGFSGDDDDSDSKLGFGFGFDIGGRYFFINNFGVFTEIGIDSYSFSYSGFKITANKYWTIGVTYKI